MTKPKLTPELRKALAELGRLGGLKGGAKGGKTTAMRRTPQERREAALKAIRARWRKHRGGKKKSR